MIKAISVALTAVLLLGTTSFASDGVWKVSYVEKVLMNRVNMARVNKGVRPMDKRFWLTVVAGKRSSDMKRFNYFGHANPYNGVGAFDIIKRMGWSHRVEDGSENIAHFYECIGLTKKKVAVRFKNAWLRSPIHRRAIFRPKWNIQGAGIVRENHGDCTHWIATLIMVKT